MILREMVTRWTDLGKTRGHAVSGRWRRALHRPRWVRLPAWLGGEPAKRLVAQSSGIDPRIEKRRIDVERRRGRRRLVVLIVVGSLSAVLGGAWLVLHSGWTSAKVVTVTGASHTALPKVIAAAGLTDHPPLLDVDPGWASDRIERLPWILRASVSRQWPDGVRIKVTERRPVAVAADGAVWAEVDGSGRVLDEVGVPPQALPQIKPAGSVGRPGGDLGPVARPALDVSAHLPAAFAAQVAVVQVTPEGGVVLAMRTPISIALGQPVDLGEKYTDVAAILAHAELHAGDVIDVSVPRSPVVAGP